MTHENSKYDDDDDDDDLPESAPGTEKWTENEEIQIFRKYLRYPTVSLTTDFGIFSESFEKFLNLKIVFKYKEKN